MSEVHWITSTLVACLVTLGSCGAAAASMELPGKYHGSLQTPYGSLALELTVTQAESGALSASIESVDQAPGQPIVASRIRVDRDDLRLEFDTISAAFEGRLDEGTHTWRGTWKQGSTLPLIWSRGPLPPAPVVEGMDGAWRAILTRNGVDLRLVLRIRTSAHGTRAKLDSPDMGMNGMDVADLAREGDHVRLRVPIANVVFDGELADKGTSLSGPWRRDGLPAAVVKFVRSPEPAHASSPRPQTPRPPFDYAIESVQVRNASANITLAGTLTLPRRGGPFAAAILITGSGPQDRDETLFGHKPFAVLADHLTRNGIAVLRLDDRGVGKSGGEFASATSLDFSTDVRAAVDFLVARLDIDEKAVGLIGHSEGGIVGPLAALRNPAVAYLVLLAAPSTGLSEVLLSQRRVMGMLQGQAEASLIATEPIMAQLFDTASRAETRAAAQARVAALLTPDAMRQLGVNESLKPVLIDQLAGDWLRWLLRYDPTTTLGAMTIPILALNGSLDRQVPANVNLAGIRRAAAHSPDVTTRELPGLNHLFQSARTGGIGEYAEITETFSPKALRTISEWINARFGR